MEKLHKHEIYRYGFILYFTSICICLTIIYKIGRRKKLHFQHLYCRFKKRKKKKARKTLNFRFKNRVYIYIYMIIIFSVVVDVIVVATIIIIIVLISILNALLTICKQNLYCVIYN
jgi:fatty acid desaturase